MTTPGNLPGDRVGTDCTPAPSVEPEAGRTRGESDTFDPLPHQPFHIPCRRGAGWGCGACPREGLALMPTSYTTCDDGIELWWSALPLFGAVAGTRGVRK